MGQGVLYMSGTCNKTIVRNSFVLEFVLLHCIWNTSMVKLPIGSIKDTNVVANDKTT